MPIVITVGAGHSSASKVSDSASDIFSSSGTGVSVSPRRRNSIQSSDDSGWDPVYTDDIEPSESASRPHLPQYRRPGSRPNGNPPPGRRNTTTGYPPPPDGYGYAPSAASGASAEYPGYGRPYYPAPNYPYPYGSTPYAAAPYGYPPSSYPDPSGQYSGYSVPPPFQYPSNPFAPGSSPYASNPFAPPPSQYPPNPFAAGSSPYPAQQMMPYGSTPAYMPQGPRATPYPAMSTSGDPTHYQDPTRGAWTDKADVSFEVDGKREDFNRVGLQLGYVPPVDLKGVPLKFDVPLSGEQKFGTSLTFSTVKSPLKNLETMCIGSSRGYNDDDGLDTVVLVQDLLKPSATHSPHIRWIHLQHDFMSLESLQKTILRDAGLSGEDVLLALQLLGKIETENEKEFVHGHYLEPLVIRCDGKPPKGTISEDRHCTFLSFPYFSNQRAPSSNKKDIIRPHPIQGLLQTLYSLESTKSRDSTQVISKTQKKGMEKSIHVPQIWAIILDTDTIITYSIHPLSALRGGNIQVTQPISTIRTSPSVIHVTDPQGRLYFFSVDQCKTWFELSEMLSSQCLPDGYYRLDQFQLLLKDGRRVTAATWPKILATETAAFIDLVIHLPPDDGYNTGYPAPPYRAPPYSASPYLAPPYPPSLYASAPHATSPYTPSPYAPSPYAPSPYVPSPYAPSPYATAPYAPPPYAAVPYPQAPHGASSYGNNAMSYGTQPPQASFQPPSYGTYPPPQPTYQTPSAYGISPAPQATMSHVDNIVPYGAPQLSQGNYQNPFSPTDVTQPAHTGSLGGYFNPSMAPQTPSYPDSSVAPHDPNPRPVPRTREEDLERAFKEQLISRRQTELRAKRASAASRGGVHHVRPHSRQRSETDENENEVDNAGDKIPHDGTKEDYEADSEVKRRKERAAAWARETTKHAQYVRSEDEQDTQPASQGSGFIPVGGKTAAESGFSGRGSSSGVASRKSKEKNPESDFRAYDEGGTKPHDKNATEVDEDTWNFGHSKKGKKKKKAAFASETLDIREPNMNEPGLSNLNDEWGFAPTTKGRSKKKKKGAAGAKAKWGDEEEEHETTKAKDAVPNFGTKSATAIEEVDDDEWGNFAGHKKSKKKATFNLDAHDEETKPNEPVSESQNDDMWGFVPSTNKVKKKEKEDVAKKSNESDDTNIRVPVIDPDLNPRVTVEEGDPFGWGSSKKTQKHTKNVQVLREESVGGSADALQLNQVKDTEATEDNGQEAIPGVDEEVIDEEVFNDGIPPPNFKPKPEATEEDDDWTSLATAWKQNKKSNRVVQPHPPTSEPPEMTEKVDAGSQPPKAVAADVSGMSKEDETEKESSYTHIVLQADEPAPPPKSPVSTADDGRGHWGTEENKKKDDSAANPQSEARAEGIQPFRPLPSTAEDSWNDWGTGGEKNERGKSAPNPQLESLSEQTPTLLSQQVSSAVNATANSEHSSGGNGEQSVRPNVEIVILPDEGASDQLESSNKISTQYRWTREELAAKYKLQKPETIGESSRRSEKSHGSDVWKGGEHTIDSISGFDPNTAMVLRYEKPEISIEEERASNTDDTKSKRSSVSFDESLENYLIQGRDSPKFTTLARFAPSTALPLSPSPDASQTRRSYAHRTRGKVAGNGISQIPDDQKRGMIINELGNYDLNPDEDLYYNPESDKDERHDVPEVFITGEIPAEEEKSPGVDQYEHAKYPRSPFAATVEDDPEPSNVTVPLGNGSTRGSRASSLSSANRKNVTLLPILMWPTKQSEINDDKEGTTEDNIFSKTTSNSNQPKESSRSFLKRGVEDEKDTSTRVNDMSSTFQSLGEVLERIHERLLSDTERGHSEIYQGLEEGQIKDSKFILSSPSPEVPGSTQQSLGAGLDAANVNLKGKSVQMPPIHSPPNLNKEKSYSHGAIAPDMEPDCQQLLERFSESANRLLEAFAPPGFFHPVIGKYYGALRTIIDILKQSQEQNSMSKKARQTHEDTQSTLWIIQDIASDIIERKDLPLMDRSFSDCTQCVANTIYGSQKEVREHLRYVHFNHSTDPKFPPLSVLSNWIKRLDRIADERRCEEQMRILKVCNENLANLEKEISQIRDGVSTQDQKHSARFRLPSSLVIGFRNLLVLLLYTVHILQSIDKKSTDWVHHWRWNPASDHQLLEDSAHLERIGVDAFEALAKGKIDLKMMITTKDFSRSVTYEAVGPQYILAMLLGNLQVGIESHNLWDVYKEYTDRLAFQVSQRPRRRLLRDFFALSEEISAVMATLEKQDRILQDYSRVLAPSSFRLTSQTRHSLFALENRLLRKSSISVRKKLTQYIELKQQVDRQIGLTKMGIEILDDDHGKAILVFTIVTLVFLPLSFVTSFMGMNTVDIRNQDATQVLFWEVAVPLTTVVIALALLVGYKFEAMREWAGR